MPEASEQPDQITVFETGPYLQAALICEKVLQERDGVLSIVRVIDRTVVAAQGTGAPEEMPPFGANLTLLITLKSGMARGSIPIRITLEQPSGISKEVGTLTAVMEGEGDRGVNLINSMTMQFTEQGLYWFAIRAGDRLLTKVPFRIIYTRTIGAMAQPGG